jgi:hypothetical protein
MRLAYELAPCQDCGMDVQIYSDRKAKNKSKSKKQKILGKVKIEKKKTPHHIAKDTAKKNGRR